MITFADFLRTVGERTTGRPIGPYPWQERLAQRCAAGSPPAVIAVPTGAGKTITVDILIWALARQAELPAPDRTIGVRIVWAIDRRLLVDEVNDHATGLARILKHALDDSSDLLHEMAVRLARLSGDAPLVATRWRGGLQERPERYGPLQPQVITSTVGQIGSRLLFRGYGVRRRSLAIEAGLAACDTTICLDEAHLAQPFRETVEAIGRFREREEQGNRLPTLRLITLTATPTGIERDTLTLSQDDQGPLARRVRAPKLAKLVELEAGLNDRARATTLAKLTADHVRDGTATVACVVNTVRRAREVFDSLAKELSDEADVILLIGPQRPADRELMLAQHRSVLFDGEQPGCPLVCVATQTFEVGLDADVAAMVTESASGAALVQRLGRLNRRGDTDGRATIVRDHESWLYGRDEAAAWSWLEELRDASGTVDVSVAALERNPPPPAIGVSRAPALDSVVDALAQTWPRPHSWADPDIETLIRGARSKPAVEVAVCWRTDLRLDRNDDSAAKYRAALLKLVPPRHEETLTLTLTAARALLAARYPGQARPNSAARLALVDADVEYGMNGSVVSEPTYSERSIPFLVIRGGAVLPGAFNSSERVDGDDRNESVTPSKLAPGDVLLLPTKAGGIDENGLAPLQPSGSHARDVGADLREPTSGSPIPTCPVRITKEAIEGTKNGSEPARDWAKVVSKCTAAQRKMEKLTDNDARRAQVEDLVADLHAIVPNHPTLAALAIAQPRHDEWTPELRALMPIDLEKLDEAAEGGVSEEIAETSVTQSSPNGQRLDGAASLAAEDAASGGEAAGAWVLLAVSAHQRDRLERSASDPPPTLRAHTHAVHDEVVCCAKKLQLDRTLQRTLALAAAGHDHGKADRRIQAFYRVGVPSWDQEPLAKSQFGTHDRRTSSVAAQLAEMPTRLHHEVASVAVVEYALARGDIDAAEVDLDLLLHLIATHHGRGRPLPDMPRGGGPPQPFEADVAGIRGIALGDGSDGWSEGAWLERFWRVMDRYGAWGAAYLETLLVLSDHVVSSRGE